MWDSVEQLTEISAWIFWPEIICAIVAALAVGAGEFFKWKQTWLRRTKILATVVFSLLFCAGRVVNWRLDLLENEQRTLRIVEADDRSPLKINAFVYDGNYPPGTQLAGIDWQKNYVDVRLSIKNEATYSVDNMDLFLQLDTSIDSVAQFTNTPDCIISAAGPVPPSLWLIGPQGTVPTEPGSQFTSSTYRVYCPKLFSRTEMRLVLASVALNPPRSPGRLPESLFAPRRAPVSLRVAGKYETLQAVPPTRYEVNEALKLSAR